MIFFWVLLTPPPAPACVLWLDHPPVTADYYPPACPLQLMLPWEYYDLRLIGVAGQTLCEWPAATSLTKIPCIPDRAKSYIIEVWLNRNVEACNLEADVLDADAVAAQCPEWLDEYKAGKLEVMGPFEITPPAPPEVPCTPPVIANRADLSTHHRYEFLEGRLTWYGFPMSEDDWQNQWDQNLAGAADAASVPAWTLKQIIGQESQFWPGWTGDKGEVGLIQLTEDGADNALRWSPDLFVKYCQLAINPMRCRSYDLLSTWERSQVRAVLMNDLKLGHWPTEDAEQIKGDLWAYAHVLAATYCQVQGITGAPQSWDVVAAVYHAGGSCIQADGSLCPEGKSYLEEMSQ